MDNLRSFYRYIKINEQQIDRLDSFVACEGDDGRTDESAHRWFHYNEI